MDRQKKTDRVGHRRGGIFTLLAFILFAATLAGLILRCFSGVGPKGAFAKTCKEIEKRESDVLFLLSALRDGSVSLNGKDLGLVWNAALGDGGYTLSAKEGKNTLGVYADSDGVTVDGSLFPDGAAFVEASGAAWKLSGSALDRETVAPAHFSFFQTLLSLADPELCSSDVLLDAAGRILKKAKPTVAKEAGALAASAGRLEVTRFTYRFDSAALVRASAAFLKEGNKEAFQRAVLSHYALFRSVCGKKLTASEQDAVLSFLKGKGKAFDSFSNLLGKSDSVLEIIFSVSDGAVISVEAEASLGDYRQSASLFLGEELATSKEASFDFLLKREDEVLLQTALKHRITDDSELAFIREWNWSVSDQTGFFFEGETEKEGTLRYSWGRSKGDLGVKWMQGDESLVLRGTLLSNKEEKEVVFRLSRVEENGVNVLPCDSAEVTVSREASLAEGPEAKQELFPSKKNKEAFGQKFEEAYHAFFGGAAG